MPSTVHAMPIHQPVRQPVLFVSHGAPDLLLDPGETGHLWAELGRQLPRPQAILAVSAHWEATRATVSASPAPGTLHDFGGFPEALYRMRYPSAGAVRLADRVAELLTAAGQPVGIDRQRGLDHGAWVPLMLMHPGADVPVAQLALGRREGPAWHRELGAVLRPLRDEGVLILASGGVTHNFGWLDGPGASPQPQAKAFADWLGETLLGARGEDLLAYRLKAPHGASAHPTEEHLLPLFVAWGASDGGDRLARLAPAYTYGGLAMDAYLWQAAGQPAFSAAPMH